MISIIRQLDFSFLCQFHIGLEKTVLIPLNSTISQNLQHSFSHGLIEFNSDSIKDYSDHILREFFLYNPIVLDYLWDLLNSVIGKNCNLFRNISKSFPELSNFITQSLNIESLRPFWYAKSAFEIFSHFQFLTDTLPPFRFCILQCTSSLTY